MAETDRQIVTAQCAYLVDEVRALEPLLRTRVSDEYLSARPIGAWSIKEMLGHLADIDRSVFRPRLHALVSEVEPVFEAYDPDELVVESGWQDLSLEEILEAVRRERAETVRLLDALPEGVWMRRGRTAEGEDRNVFDLAADVARHDAHHLRAVAYRLHESRISARPLDLPK